MESREKTETSVAPFYVAGPARGPLGPLGPHVELEVTREFP
jgi:hypothetical protein